MFIEYKRKEMRRSREIARRKKEKRARTGGRINTKNKKNHIRRRKDKTTKKLQ